MNEPSFLVAYRLRTVRVGVEATALILGALALVPLLPVAVELQVAPFLILLGIAGAGAAVIAALPWRRMFESRLGMWTMYAWSVLDILLITILMTVSGDERSFLFVLYALTTIFFAVSYPPRAQVSLFLFTLVSYLVAGWVDDWQLAAGETLGRFATLLALTYIAGFLARELMEQNAELQQEADRHLETARALATNRHQLEAAQSLARIGSWEWEMDSNRVKWSKELHRIFGLKQGEFRETLEAVFEHVVPEDRQAVQEKVAEARSGHDVTYEFRIRRVDGEVRTLRGWGTTELDSTETPKRMIGTLQDVTDERRAEDLHRRLELADLREHQALELHDTVVQGLAAGVMALQMGRVDHAQRLFDQTLAKARALVSGLLDARKDDLAPGDLVRDRPASVLSEREEESA